MQVSRDGEEVPAVFWSGYVPCGDCGEAIQRSAVDVHSCDPQRRLDFQMQTMRRELLAFDTEVREYLSGNEGRFEVWLAARDVRRSRRIA